MRAKGKDSYKELRTRLARRDLAVLFVPPFQRCKGTTVTNPKSASPSQHGLGASFRTQGEDGNTVLVQRTQRAHRARSPRLANRSWWSQKKFPNFAGNRPAWRGRQGSPLHPPKPPGQPGSSCLSPKVSGRGLTAASTVSPMHCHLEGSPVLPIGYPPITQPRHLVSSASLPHNCV